MKRIIGYLLLLSIVCGMIQPIHVHAAAKDPCGLGCSLLETAEVTDASDNTRIVIYTYECGTYAEQYVNGVLTMDATLLYANGYMKQNTYTTGALSNTSSRIVDYEPTCLYDNTVMSLDITDDMEADGYSYEKQGGSYAAAPFFEGDCKLYVKHWDGIKNDYIAIAWDKIYADTVFELLVIMWCGATEAVNVIFAKEVLEYAVEAKDFLDAFTGKNTFYQYEHYNAIEMCRGVVFDVCVQETVYRNDEYRVINAGNEKEEKVFSKDGVYYQNNAEDFMDYCLGRYYNDYHFPLYVNENCNRM